MDRNPEAAAAMLRKVAESCPEELKYSPQAARVLDRLRRLDCETTRGEAAGDRPAHRVNAGRPGPWKGTRGRSELTAAAKKLTSGSRYGIAFSGINTYEGSRGSSCRSCGATAATRPSLKKPGNRAGAV